MPDVTVPTPDEILKLPHWAQVALAARCARRVQPLYTRFREATDKNVAAVDRAITLAETAATRAMLVGTDARAAATVVYLDAAGVYAAHTAAHAATAAHADEVTKATANAVRDAILAGSSKSALVKQMIRQDFLTLVDIAQRDNWTDKTPVPPSVFGPLWPDEAPDWAVSNTSKTPAAEPTPIKASPQPARRQRLIVTATVPEHLDAEVVTEELLALYRTMNDHFIALGGPGLTLEEFRRLVPAGVPVEV